MKPKFQTVKIKRDHSLIGSFLALVIAILLMLQFTQILKPIYALFKGSEPTKEEMQIASKYIDAFSWIAIGLLIASTGYILIPILGVFAGIMIIAGLTAVYIGIRIFMKIPIKGKKPE